MKLLSIILWLIQRTEISFLQPLEIISKKGYESEFELSEYIWQMKDESKNCNIHWKIFTYARAYKCGTRRYELCLTEKYMIASADQEHLLNERSEIISECSHRNRH